MITAVRTGEIPFDAAFHMNFFEFLQSDPDFADLFNRFMGNSTAATADAVAESYDFSGARTIVDVGGGNGRLLRTILKHYSGPTGTILDAAMLRKQAESRIESDGLLGRCTFVEGDFFGEIPKGADLYLLKSVIHDWDDSRAIQIFRNCRNAMTATSAVLIVEGIIDPVKPAMNVLMGDIVMLTMAPGRERTIDEFESLLQKAGLRLEQTISTPASVTIMKALPQP